MNEVNVLDNVWARVAAERRNFMGGYMYFEHYQEFPYLDIQKEEDKTDIAKYSKILFFQSSKDDSRLSHLSPEVNCKIASFTGRNNVVNEKEAEKIAVNNFC